VIVIVILIIIGLILSGRNKKKIKK
jgi:hypothetical protein